MDHAGVLVRNRKNRGRGKGHESRVAGMIQEAFEVGQDDCHRISGSGTRKGLPGDVFISQALSMRFPFAIECKNEQKWSWSRLLSQSGTLDKQMEGWWAQATKAAQSKRLRPLVVFTRPHLKGLPKERVWCLVQSDDVFPRDNLSDWGINFITVMYPGTTRNSLKILLFESFLKNWRKIS